MFFSLQKFYKIFLFIVVIIGISLAVAGSYFYFFQSKPKIVVIDKHSRLSIRVTALDIFTFPKIAEKLQKHNIKSLSITLSEDVQGDFQQLFDKEEGVYISDSYSVSKDTLFIVIHIDDQILKKYNWQSPSLSQQTLLHIFREIYILDDEYKDSNEYQVSFEKYINEGIPLPFEISYDN